MGRMDSTNTREEGSGPSQSPGFHIDPFLLRSGTRGHVPGRLLLVRHGRTRYNRLGRFQGVIDIPLDGHGRWQARRSARALRRTYVDRPRRQGRPRRQLVVSSDLSRAEQTAHAFADPLSLPVHTDKRLEERDFGEWEGVGFDEARRRWPDDYASMASNRGGELRHGFETVEHAGARAEAALDDWAGRCGADTDLFVFFHGSVLAIVVQKLIGLGYGTEAISLGGLANACWAELRPMFVGEDRYVWSLAAYNKGPVESLDPARWD